MKKPLTAPHRVIPKLAVFDVEGVLIPRNRLFFEIGKTLGLLPLLKILFYGFLYEVGAMQLTSALKKIFLTTRGRKVDLYFKSLDKLPFMPKALEAFATLKAEGCKTALISSGLPTFLVEKLANMVGADYAIGVEVGMEGEILTGEIWGDVIERDGKILVLRELIESEEVNLNECVVVADDRNNSSIFLKDIHKIGYNADFVIRVKADAVVNGKLTNILPIIHGEKKRRPRPERNDVLREIIHASGFFVPIVASFISIPLAASLIGVVIVFYVVSEMLRIRGKSLPVISQITRYAASQSELCEFTFAPLYFASGILLTLLLFPVPASSAAIAIFALGDSSASLIGGSLSLRPMPFNRTKTFEGSLGGFIFAFLAGCVFVAPWLAFVGAVVAMTVEYLPLPVNDNILMPLCTGLVLMLLI